MKPQRLLSIVAFAASTACASAGRGPAESAGDAPPSAVRPLASIASQRVVLAPLQRLRGADSVGWGQAVGAPAAYRRQVDDEILFALRERELGGGWVLPAELAANARRNASLASDPYALQVAPLIAPARSSGGPVEVDEPLAGELRSLIALGDARYVLIPAELRFERAVRPAGAARAVLRVALVDARLSRVRWMGDVASDSSSAFSPAIAAGVAGRLADLIAPLP